MHVTTILADNVLAKGSVFNAGSRVNMTSQAVQTYNKQFSQFSQTDYQQHFI